MIKCRSKVDVACHRSDHAPVFMMAIGVSDKSIQQEIASEEFSSIRNVCGRRPPQREKWLSVLQRLRHTINGMRGDMKFGNAWLVIRVGLAQELVSENERL